MGLRSGEGTLGTKAKGGHPDFREKKGTPRCYMGAPELGILVSETRHPRILSGDSQFADEWRNPGWTAAGRGSLQISLSMMKGGLS